MDWMFQARDSHSGEVKSNRETCFVASLACLACCSKPSPTSASSFKNPFVVIGQFGLLISFKCASYFLLEHVRTLRTLRSLMMTASEAPFKILASFSAKVSSVSLHIKFSWVVPESVRKLGSLVVGVGWLELRLAVAIAIASHAALNV